MSKNGIDLESFAKSKEFQIRVAKQVNIMNQMWRSFDFMYDAEAIAVFTRCLLHEMQDHNPQVWKDSAECMKILYNNEILRFDCGHR